MVSEVLLSIWFLTPLLGFIFLGTWMYMDATNRRIEPAFLWIASTLVFLPALLWYLYERRQTTTGEAPDSYQRAAATGAWAVGVTMIVVGVITPPDPLSVMKSYSIILPIALIVMYLVVYRGRYKRLWETARD